VKWPENLSQRRVSPEKVFSDDLHLLNPIRTEDEVFIIRIGQQEGFEILGSDEIRVGTAEQHLLNMLQKAQVKYGAIKTVHIILDEREGIEVEMGKAEDWWPIPHAAESWIVPRLLPSPAMNLTGSFRMDGLHFTQLSVIQQAVHLALDAIRFDNSHFDFNIRFGCLGIPRRRFMKNEPIGNIYSKENFLNLVTHTVDCEAKKWYVV
jgi:hypothetical protein